jgi:HlyD family secretion protein
VNSDRKAQEGESKYRTAQIDRGSIAQAVLATGTLQPVTSVSVGVQVSGTVSERLVDFNDRVKAGQILVRLDPATFLAHLHQARAQLQSAEASLGVAKANVQRNKRLLAAGFISSSAQEQIDREADVALANVELAKAQLDAAQTDLNNSIVRSPIDGIVIKRNIDIGQTVAAAFQTPDLFQIAQDLHKMQIYTNVSEADVGYIKAGQKVEFDVDAYEGREFTGEVVQFRLSPTNTSGIVTYNVVIEVNNTDELLKPGMTAQARIVVAKKSDILRIPTAALRFQPGDQDRLKTKRDSGSSKSVDPGSDPNDDGVSSGTRDGNRLYRIYTTLRDEDKVEWLMEHDVTIGISNTRFTELATSDLKAGDKVITRVLSPAAKG